MKTLNYKKKRCGKKSGPVLCASAIAISVALAAPPSIAQDLAAHEIEINAQPLSSALNALAQQVDKQIVIYADDARNIFVEPLNGSYTDEDALKALLRGSDLHYVFFNERTIAVGTPQRLALAVEANQQTQASKAQAPEGEPTEENADSPIETVEPSEDEADDTSADQIVITGTRIKGADPTQRVTTITLDELRASGVTTVEDAIRRVQSNFSSLNSDTGRLAAANEGLQLGQVPDGISGVNLRGLGTENTLVLLNGRRIAGTAGNFDSFTNIANIPLSAIERIEILPDGASAAYGSDAVGGVINIILRKDYQGAEITGRYERSSTDANGYKVNGVFGTGWGSGRLTITGTYNDQDRVRASQAGFTTLFFPNLATNEAGDIVDLDFRRNRPATGVALRRELIFLPGPPFFMLNQSELALPPDNDGTNATLADFVDAETVAQFFDQELIPELLNTEREQFGFTADLSQQLTPDLEFHANALWSQSSTFREAGAFLLRTFVGANNAFNPFGERQLFTYLPLTEINNGILQPPTFITEQEQLNVTAGLRWDVAKDLEFELTGGYSRSDSVSIQRNLSDASALGADPDSVLNSSDPAVAINLIGNGTAQNPDAIQTLFGRTVESRPVTELWSIEPVLSGDAFDIWGGAIKFALGGEYREESLSRSDLLSINTSTSENTTNIFGVFAEINVPLVSAKNARPGVQSFSISAQARYDDYSTQGPVSAETVNVNYNNVSPRVGVAYSPIEGLDLRASWGESFRAPTAGELFGGLSQFPLPFLDPLAPGGPTLIPDLITVFASSNPNLQPETSDNISVGAVFRPAFAKNLEFRFDWSRVDFENRIINAAELQLNLPAEVFVTLPGVLDRDASGNAVQLNLSNLNLERRVVETLETGFQYTHDTAKYGQFIVGLDAIYYFELFDQVSGLVDPIETLGTSRGPVEYKLTGHVGWQGQDMGADLFVYHTPSNINTQQVVDPGSLSFSTLSHPVDGYTTVDLSAYYEITEIGLRISAGARNILDADFPLSPTRGLSYNPSRVDPRGRVAFIELRKSF